MLELRRRFKGEVVALSEYLDRDLVALWGYDGSPEAAAATRDAGSGARTSSSSGTPRAAPRRSTRCCARHPQMFMPELKEPWFLASDMLPRSSRPRSATPLPETLEEYLALFARRQPPSSAPGEASPLYLLSETAAERIAELRPDARIIAILREPASFLRSLHLQPCSTRIENKTDLGAGYRPGRRAGAKGKTDPAIAPSCARRSLHIPTMYATSSSCAATTRVPARAGAGADLRRLPHATTRRTVRTVLRSSASMAARRRSSARREPDGGACAHSGSTSCCTRVGRRGGPLSHALEAVL